MPDQLLSIDVAPNWQGLYDCILGKGTPDRVYVMELFLDPEVQRAIIERYGLLQDLDPADAHFLHRAYIDVQRFLGYDYVVSGVDAPAPEFNLSAAQDTAGLQRQGGRQYMDEHRGPITSWEEFEAYPWPDADELTTETLEWYQDNLPEDMCIVGSLVGHFAEWLTWLMGYETLCYALYDQRDLVRAISDRLVELFRARMSRLIEFDRVKMIWGSDDMGYRSGTLISPDDTREFILPGHKLIAGMSHQAGRPYLLHSCGNLEEIMPDLIDDVRIDAKHSFEDTIESVIEDKKLYGDRIALLGGIDVDFLCRANEEQIRQRVRETLEVCQPGGRYCLGTGNSVANYIPVENYLVMLDEGRRFSA